MVKKIIFDEQYNFLKGTTDSVNVLKEINKPSKTKHAKCCIIIKCTIS